MSIYYVIHFYSHEIRLVREALSDSKLKGFNLDVPEDFSTFFTSKKRVMSKRVTLSYESFKKLIEILNADFDYLYSLTDSGSDISYKDRKLVIGRLNSISDLVSKIEYCLDDQQERC